MMASGNSLVLRARRTWPSRLPLSVFSVDMVTSTVTATSAVPVSSIEPDTSGVRPTAVKAPIPPASTSFTRNPAKLTAGSPKRSTVPSAACTAHTPASPPTESAV